MFYSNSDIKFFHNHGLTNKLHSRLHKPTNSIFGQNSLRYKWLKSEYTNIAGTDNTTVLQKYQKEKICSDTNLSVHSFQKVHESTQIHKRKILAHEKYESS